MRNRIVTTALASTAAVAGLLGTATPASAATYYDMTIRSAATGMCLAPEGRTSEEGVAIIQTYCNGDPYQRWDFVDLGSGVYQIRNAVTLKCMDVAGSNIDGTAVVQWTCASITNQRFEAKPKLPGYVTLKTRVAGTKTHCLDVPGEQPIDGLAIIIWSCGGYAGQTFGVFSA